MPKNPWTRLVTMTFMVTIPILGLAIVTFFIMFWGLGIDRLGDNTLVIANDAPLPQRRTIGLIAALVPSLLVLQSLWHLFEMFRGIHSGNALTRKTVKSLRWFSTYACLATISAIALSGVIRWAMGEFDDQPLWTHLQISPVDLAVLFMAGVTWAASSAIEDGIAMAREVQDYV